MRVSPVAWIYDDLKDVREYAALTASVTHNHPEGIKGAEATATAIFLARKGFSKKFIRSYISNAYGYDFSRTCDEIRPTYHHVESCQETVPEALTAFFEGDSFEEVLRLAVSLGGDSDTLACITGGIAEAYYQHIPDTILRQAAEKLPAEFLRVIDYFKQGSFYQQMSPREVLGKVDDIVERRYTPENIKELEKGQVFVFGSNLAGAHGGGAAAAAVRYFGAVWGQGVGMQGQSYAIPTMHGGVDVIKPYVDEFIQYAKEHPELTFLVTRIGCGIAGFRDEEIAPLFSDALALRNVLLPKSFVDVLDR